MNTAPIQAGMATIVGMSLISTHPRSQPRVILIPHGLQTGMAVASGVPLHAYVTRAKRIVSGLGQFGHRSTLRSSTGPQSPEIGDF